MILRIQSTPFFFLIGIAVFLSACTKPETKDVKKLNVLFVSIDDLGPNLGVYDNPHIVSPNLDAFAKKGTTLETPFVKPLYAPHREPA